MSDLSYPTKASRHAEGLRPDWFRSAILAGFGATFAMTVTLTGGYLLADGLGKADGSRFEQWMYNLSSNELTDRMDDQFGYWMIVNLAVGLVWALIYARYAEPMRHDSGWKEGFTFALIPFVLSIVIFFPLMGVGIFGIDLDAGPLPMIGNLIVHLVFGVVLGTIYAIRESEWVGDSIDEHVAAESAERGAVFGIAAGGVVGLIGGWLIGPSLDGLASQPVMAMAGALSGAAIGSMVGSIVSLARTEEMKATSQGMPTTHLTDRAQ